MTPRQMLVDPSKYWLKCPNAMAPEFIVIHNTANDASANNEISYMRTNSSETSFHFAIDDVEVVQGLPLNRNGWHAGDGGNGNGNRKGIGIEICYSRSGGERFIKAEQNAAMFTAQLLKERGWGMDRVRKHQDFMNKYCPHRTLDMGWGRFLSMVQSYLTPPPPPKPAITYSTEGLPKLFVVPAGSKLWDFNFTKWPEAKAIKTFETETKLEAVAMATNSLGGKYYMTAYSYDNGRIRATNGVNIVGLKEYIPPTETPVEPEKPVEPEIPAEPETPVEPEAPVDYSKENNSLLKTILELLQSLISKITGIFK